MLKLIYTLAILLLYVIEISSDSVDSYEVYRLPKTIHPTHYKVQVLTHLDEGGEDSFKFYGKVWIKLICDETTNNITLHSKNLTISFSDIKLNEVVENSVTENVIEYDQPQIDLENEYLIIPTKTELVKGKEYELLIPFKGELLEGLLGYYKSSYIDSETNKKTWLSITQFEATYARRAFPCFDEPEFKAKFEIILGHEKSLKALSNMPIKLTTPVENKPDWVWDHFEESVPMSTYLVAYSINDFEYREQIADLKKPITFKIWARRDAIDQVVYALGIGPRVLKYFESYFDVKFPLPKMDMIAIPDFSAGAMENWGLVTYRETALLYLANVSSLSAKQRVADVVAHELAHQWFGNLVTMKWWTDLWLNEGFATYVETLGVQHLHPEWDASNDESSESFTYVYNLDSLKSSHPVSVKIGNPSEISQIFDAISYQKGSSIIRMMHFFLGENAFRYGVSNYLKNHIYGNAEQDDLWDSLTKEAHAHNSLNSSIKVKTIMDTWTLQTGFPSVAAVRNYDDNSVELTQKRYLADSNVTSSDYNSCWIIPITYTTQHEVEFIDTKDSCNVNFSKTENIETNLLDDDKKEFSFWTENDVSSCSDSNFKNKNNEHTINTLIQFLPKAWMECEDKVSMKLKLSNIGKPDEWVIFNKQLSGLYKVNYDQRNWELLHQYLNSPNYQRINYINRGQLIDDAFDFATVGELQYSIPLALVRYLGQETEYIPWRIGLSNLGRLNNLLKRSSDYGYFKAFMKKIIAPIYKTLGVLHASKKSETSLQNAKHSALVAVWACRFNIDDCITRTKSLFTEWMTSEKPDEHNPIPSDLKSTVYCNSIRKGDETEWNFLWERYLKSNVAAEKILIVQALGCTQELWLLKRYLKWSTNGDYIRKQDLSYVFSSVASNDLGYYLAKDFFYQNIEQIYHYYRPEASRIGRLFRPITDAMMTKYEYNEFKNFASKHKGIFDKASQAYQQSLEKIKINIQWHDQNYKEVVQYLKSV